MFYKGKGQCPGERQRALYVINVFFIQPISIKLQRRSPFSVQSQALLFGGRLLTVGRRWLFFDERRTTSGKKRKHINRKGTAGGRKTDHVFFREGAGSPPDRHPAPRTRSTKDNDPKGWRWSAHRAAVQAIPPGDEEPEVPGGVHQWSHVVLDPVALLAWPRRGPWSLPLARCFRVDRWGAWNPTRRRDIRSGEIHAAVQVFVEIFRLLLKSLLYIN